MKRIVLTLTALLMGSGLAIADCIPPDGDCDDCRRCYPSSTDRDGDGYAAAGAAPCMKPREGSLYCPAGYVNMDGDCNDDDASVHPRRTEIAFNDQDDDCTGGVDQTTFVYAAAGQRSTTTGFDVKARVNDNRIFNTANLYVRAQYAKLADSANLQWTTRRQVTGLSAQNVVVTIPINTLAEARVYRVRVEFLSRSANGTYTRVGDLSPWYYTSTQGRSSEEQRRTGIVLRALYEANASSLGNVGYLGTVRDGTRYGASRDEAWCSEFYAWSAHLWVAGLEDQATVQQLVDWFTAQDNYFDAADIQARARRADYLPQDPDADGDGDHSSMFLAYDTSRVPAVVWTVEGNAKGSSELPYGNQAMVKTRGLGTFFGLGHLTAGLLGVPPPPVVR